MRVSAEFDDTDVALAATRLLTEEGGVAADDIEIRSAWPLFEEALPPHFHRPMRIRNFVRFLWVCGAICGFSLVWYCQTDYPIRTSGHPIVPVPIDAIITYECAQITGLIMTTFFFFIETNIFRMRPIPEEEDLAVANGQLAIVVNGPRAEAAKGILERGGARVVRTFNSLLLGLLVIAALFTTGCGDLVQQVAQFPQVRMRTQTGHGIPGWPLDPNRAWPIKDQENINAGYDPGTYSMPWTKDPDIGKMTEPYGKLLSGAELMRMQREHPGRSTPPEVKNFENPTDNTTASEQRGQQIYAENCIFCHGPQGKGDGLVGQIYAIPPADLSGTVRKDLLPPGMAPTGQGQTDGDLFWTITVAPPSNVMPAFGAKLGPMDRFYVVRYLRKLQRDGGAAIPPASTQPGTQPAPGQPGSAQSPSAGPTSTATNTPAPGSDVSAPGAPSSGSPHPMTATPQGEQPPTAGKSGEPSGAPASGAPASGAPASGAPASGAPASGQPDAQTPAPGQAPASGAPASPAAK